MKECINLIFFILLMLFSKSLLSQNNIKVDTLIDKINGNRYFMDEQKKYLVSTNEKGIVLWKTDSISDVIQRLIFDTLNILTIRSFSFEPERIVTQKDTILVTYSDNSRYCLDKISGKVIWHWRD